MNRQQHTPERLQKLLASAGHGSRRTIEDWVREGRVTVNGRLAQLGDRACADDDVRLDGKRLPLGGASVRHAEVLVYHKPIGEVTTRHDPQGRPTVFERLPAPPAGRWINVGRLDVNTSGLLLFTTDGELAHRLMHPSTEIEREYVVRVRSRPDADVVRRLVEGIQLEDGLGRFNQVIPMRSEGSHSWYRVVLCEGRNREVRRMWEAVGFEVSRLTRVRYGSVELPRNLPPGSSRLLPAAEVERLIATTTAAKAATPVVPSAPAQADDNPDWSRNSGRKTHGKPQSVHEAPVHGDDRRRPGLRKRDRSTTGLQQGRDQSRKARR